MRNVAVACSSPRRPALTLQALGLGLLLAGCAGGGSSVTAPPTDCPQPRFTGKAPEPVRSRTNPLPDDDSLVAVGKEIYQGGVQPACYKCHGRKGDGRGPLSTQFNPRPRNFSCESTINGIPDGQLFWIVKNGSPGTAMPGFDKELSDREIWQVVLYLRRIAER